MIAGPRFLSVLMMMKFSLARRWLMVCDCTLVMLVERRWFSALSLISCDRRDLNWLSRISISGLACGGCQDLFLM